LPFFFSGCAAGGAFAGCAAGLRLRARLRLSLRRLLLAPLFRWPRLRLPLLSHRLRLWCRLRARLHLPLLSHRSRLWRRLRLCLLLSILLLTHRWTYVARIAGLRLRWLLARARSIFRSPLSFRRRRLLIRR
jgi:hypothetical protein